MNQCFTEIANYQYHIQYCLFVRKTNNLIKKKNNSKIGIWDGRVRISLRLKMCNSVSVQSYYTQM